MARVTGIGGVFFVAADPTGLSRWYSDHLGVPAPPQSYEDDSWVQQAGPTIFAPMAADSGHVVARGWSLNFRVDDLDELVGQLRAAGIDVAVDPERYPNGRFAELNDPEGNLVQLWETAGD